jgi:hypothetical protein
MMTTARPGVNAGLLHVLRCPSYASPTATGLADVRVRPCFGWLAEGIKPS